MSVGISYQNKQYMSKKDERYTWRHDSVLSVIADTLDKARRKKRTVAKGPKFVNFVKKGEAVKGTKADKGVLATAGD